MGEVEIAAEMVVVEKAEVMEVGRADGGLVAVEMVVETVAVVRAVLKEAGRRRRRRWRW